MGYIRDTLASTADNSLVDFVNLQFHNIPTLNHPEKGDTYTAYAKYDWSGGRYHIAAIQEAAAPETATC